MYRIAANYKYFLPLEIEYEILISDGDDHLSPVLHKKGDRIGLSIFFFFFSLRYIRLSFIVAWGGGGL